MTSHTAPSTADPGVQPQWERSKENVAPVRAGRHMPTLTDALSSSQADLRVQRRQFEAAVRAAHNGDGPHAADPLAPWVLYVKWVVDHYPAGDALLTSVVEKPCRLYAKDARYRDDRRFVRLWVRYADMRSDKLDVFEYMQRHGIGATAALFYEAWAGTLEMARQFDKAEEVYALARDNRAKPADRLEQREKDFYARMSARRRRAEAKAQEKQMRTIADAAREQQQQQTDPGARGSALADAVLAAPTHPELDENGKPKSRRPALGDISERHARTGRRPMAARHSAASSSTRPLQQRLQAKPRGSNVPPPRMEVHVDPAEPKHVLPPQDDDDLPPIPKRSAVENDGPVLKWAGQTLPQNAKLKKRRIAPAPAEPMQVYTGPDPETEATATGGDAENENCYQDGVGNNTIVRTMIAEIAERAPPAERRPSAQSASTGTDAQRKQAAYNEARESAPTSVRGDSRATESAAASAVKPAPAPLAERHGPQKRAALAEILRSEVPRPQSPAPRPAPKELQMVSSPTINTKLALEEVDDAFNQTLPMERFRKERLSPMDMRGNMHPLNATRSPLQVITKKPAGRIEVCVDEGADKENTHGRVRHRDNPGDNPLVEKRVLQPRPELEAHDETDVVEVAAEVDDVLSCLARWAEELDNVHVIDGPEPEMVHDMFDFELSGGEKILSLRPFQSFDGHRKQSKVLVAEDLNDVFKLCPPQDEDDSDAEAQGIVAVKVSSVAETAPPAMWEFYVYKTLEQRSTEPLRGIPRALAYVESIKKAFLVLDQQSLGTLRQATAVEDDGVMGERVCMVFVADLLRTLELAHGCGIVHGDVTMDNVLTRASNDALFDMQTYSAKGENRWNEIGVLLVDWNHAIDQHHECVGGAIEGVLSEAKAKGQAFRDAAYRMKDDEWGYNADCYGAAVCARDALGVTFEKAQREVDALTYHEMWQTIFNKLTTLPTMTTAQQSVTVLAECRGMIEKILPSVGLLALEVQTLFSKLEDAEDVVAEPNIAL